MRFYLRAIAYFRADLPLIVASLVLVAFSTLAAVVQPLALKILVDTIFGSNQNPRWINRAFLALVHYFRIASDDHYRQVLTLAIVTLALRVGQEILAMAQRIL